MVALGGTASVTADLLLGRRIVDTRRLIVGFGVSGCREFGEQCVDGGPQFGGDPAGESAHPVEALRPEGDAAFAGVLPLVVEGAVLVEIAQQLPGDLAKSLRSMAPREPAELRFGSRPRCRVDIRW